MEFPKWQVGMKDFERKLEVREDKLQKRLRSLVGIRDLDDFRGASMAMKSVNSL